MIPLDEGIDGIIGGENIDIGGGPENAGLVGPVEGAGLLLPLLPDPRILAELDAIIAEYCSCCIRWWICA